MAYRASVWTWNGSKFVHISDISAKTLPGIKSLASRICNGYYNDIDKIDVTFYGEYSAVSAPVAFYRRNVRPPSNSIRRGIWK